jgi:hypothetical protein
MRTCNRSPLPRFSASRASRVRRSSSPRTWPAGGGTATLPLAPAPFAAMFGGLAQFAAGMWAYRARDAIATPAHGTWGSLRPIEPEWAEPDVKLGQ